MNSIINTINTVVDTVADVISHVPSSTSDLTQRQVVMLEEAERQRRQHSPEDELQRKNNGGLASSLIKDLKFPYFALARLEGAKRMTLRAEEQERARRLYSKPESFLRKSNANRTASMIQSLGWPFHNMHSGSGPAFIFANPTSLAEDEERTYRINNPLLAQIAKNNAAFASNAIRWGFPSHALAAQNGTKRFTRSMEEKERTRRLNDQEEVFRNCQKSYETAGLIRQLGWPFYTQTRSVPTSGLNIAAIAEKEQQRRLDDVMEQRDAREHANRVSRLIPSAQISLPAVRDSPQVSREYTTYLPLESLEELEASNDFLPEPVHDINQAYEQERSRQLRDPQSQQFAREGASQIASLIRSQPAAVERTVDPIEDERLARMHDWSLQQQQQKNARQVSRLISERNQPAPVSRGLNMNAQAPQRDYTTIVVRRESIVPRSTFPSSEPLATPSTPISHSNPFAHDLVDQGLMNNWNTSMAPISAAPAASFPMMPATPISAAPVSSMAAPVHSGPGFYPAQAPLGYQSQSTYTPATIQTISSAPSYASTPSFSSAPSYYSAQGTHNLTDQQLKRLQRQATKHQKTAVKEERKATKSATKAQKLHQRGKDSRAVKLETSQQAHLIAAKNHSQWANELLMKKQQNESFAPAMGYPMM